MKDPIAEIGPRTLGQLDADNTGNIAMPFLAAIDGIDPTIPETHRTGIVMTACGISHRLTALHIGVDPWTVLSWRRKYNREIEGLRPTVRTIASQLIGGLCADLVTVALSAIPGLAERAQDGDMDGKELLAVTMAAGRLTDLAEKLESSPKIRHNRQLTVSREEAEKAWKSLQAFKV